MQFNRTTRLALLLGVAIPLSLSAQKGAEGSEDKSGSVAFKFLNLQYDARGAALGGLSAQAGGAEALFWNPAGIASASGVGFNAGMTQWLVETSYMNAGAVIPMAGGVLGVAFVAVDYGDFMKSGWSETSGSYVFEANQGTFTASDNALQLSYGRFLSDKFSIGASAKTISESIDDASLSGLVFDVGTQFNTGYKNIRMGATISNFGPSIEPVETETESNLSPPMTFNFGIVGQAFGDDNMGLVAGVNVVKYSDMAQRVALNGEMTVAGMVKLRGSYTLGDLVQDGLSFGAGVNLAGVSVNFAMTQMEAFDPVMRFSLGYQM